MAASPVSGPSPTQLAVLEQIRALRAVKPPVAAAAAAQSAAPAQAKPVVSPAIDDTRAVLSAANPPPANRPRGSILNITA